jgi:ADP-heptose:LPS heptosyltransferase
VLKAIERLIRAFTLRLLGLLSRRRNGGSAKVSADFGTAPKILLLRHDRIGDVLATTPTISKLLQRFPNARVDMLFGEKNAAVASLIPGIHTRWVLPRSPIALISVLRSIRAIRYDAVVNLLSGRSASGDLLVAVTRGGFRIGYSNDNEALYDCAVARPDRTMHIVRETTLLLEPFGIEPAHVPPSSSEEFLRIDISNDQLRWAQGVIDSLHLEEQGPLVIVNISTRGDERFLGSEKYSELLSLLMRLGVHPVVCAAPGDQQRQEEIASSSGAQGLPITPRLGDFCALLGYADYVITPDTSVVHLAAALRRPTVMLATSASNAEGWYPWGVGYEVVVGSGGIPTIEVDEIVNAFVRLNSATMVPPSTSLPE